MLPTRSHHQPPSILPPSSHAGGTTCWFAHPPFSPTHTSHWPCHQTLHSPSPPSRVLSSPQVLSAVPRDVLDDLAKRIKARSAWLSSEEQREYKRAKLLNVMGCALASPPRSSPPVLPPASATLAPSPLRIFNTHNLTAAAGGGAAAAPEADAFCSDVLGGGGSGGMQLERLEMDPLLAGLPPFLTPADGRRGKAASLAAMGGRQSGGSGGAALAGAWVQLLPCWCIVFLSWLWCRVLYSVG